jgi:cyanophycin synthetase
MRKNQSYCFDCQKSKICHIESQIDGFFSFLPPINLPQFINKNTDLFFLKIFEALKILKYELIENINLIKIAPRFKLFLKEAQKEGWKIFISKTPWGYISHFKIQTPNKKVYFSGLPTADFLNSKIQLVDNKNYVKKILKKHALPIVEGKSFWFWQKKKALSYAQKIGWPLVVKPTTGTFARHVTTNIQNENDLIKAINKALEYAPNFIVEKFIDNAFVYRITVIDFEKIFGVKQVPANVIGDGKSTIQELINQKNKEREDLNKNPEFIFHKIQIDETTNKLLEKQGFNYLSVPPKNQIVYLQKDSFLRLGGDLIEVTPDIHPENKELFIKIAKIFNVRVVGIDFLAEDISSSFKNQKCAVLELNTSPCIELHTFVTKGKPQNVAKEIVALFKKYYL